jgi:hypothetical protein
MAKPAASSLALLMRRPEDKRWMDVLSDVWLAPRLRCAVSEATLVLIVDAMPMPRPSFLGVWCGTTVPYLEVISAPYRRT